MLETPSLPLSTSTTSILQRLRQFRQRFARSVLSIEAAARAADEAGVQVP